MKDQPKECKQCDFANAKRVSRATYVCPKCGRDISLEYVFWHQAAHPQIISGTNAILDVDADESGASYISI